MPHNAQEQYPMPLPVWSGPRRHCDPIWRHSRVASRRRLQSIVSLDSFARLRNASRGPQKAAGMRCWRIRPWKIAARLKCNKFYNCLSIIFDGEDDETDFIDSTKRQHCHKPEFHNPDGSRGCNHAFDFTLSRLLTVCWMPQFGHTNTHVAMQTTVVYADVTSARSRSFVAGAKNVGEKESAVEMQ